MLYFDFDPDSPLQRDLCRLSEEADDLIGITLRIHFHADFPFAPPLVYIVAPTLVSGPPPHCPPLRSSPRARPALASLLP